MVQTLAANGTNDPFDVRPLPRGSRRGQNFVDPHVFDLPAKFLSEDGVAIAQQVARDLFKRKRFSQLLSGPFRGWVGGHIEMKNATTAMTQHQKYVKHLKTNCRHGKEVDRDQLLEVILQKGAPGGLRLRTMYLLTLLSPTLMPSLSNSPWMRGAPQVGFSRHILRIRSRTSWGKRGSSRLAPSNLPRPEKTKAPAVPAKDRLWLNDGQRRAPVAPNAGQPSP
jgi:hypothetical protein